MSGLAALCKEHDQRAEELGIQEKPAELPQLKAPAGDVIRLVQWNILAHSLSDDGFLVKHILQPYADCPPYEDLVEKVAKAHACGDTDALQSIAEANKSDEAVANHAAVVDWHRRWARIRAMIAAFQPHIITLEELDHMEDAQPQLKELGYVCGRPADAAGGGREARYVPRRDAMKGKAPLREYMDALEEAGVAFMPKRPSTGRKLANQAGRPDADDDGNAVFWRADFFELVKLSWVPVQGPKRYEGAVQVDLKRKSDGQPLTVFCAHITSGAKPEDDKERERDIDGNTLDPNNPDESRNDTQPSLKQRFAASVERVPTIFCMDANAAPDRLADEPGAVTPWRSFRGLRGTTSVWDDFFHPNGAAKPGKPTPWTTNKMRGPLSGQPKKVGEHAIGVIDHIFLGGGVQLVSHAWGPLTCESLEAARQEMLPTLSIPSDHAPVVVDVRIARSAEHQRGSEERGRAGRCSYCAVS